MINRSIMRLVLVVTIVFLVKVEGTTTNQPKSSHYSGRRILSTGDKKNMDSYNNYLHLMQSNFDSSSSEGNRRLDVDPYYSSDNDLDIESNSSTTNNADEEIDLNSWDDSQHHHTVTKYINSNNYNYKDTATTTNNDNNYKDEDAHSSDQYNSLYYEPSYSPAVQESSWPYSNNYYTHDEKTTLTTSTPSSVSISEYYEPSYNAPKYGHSTEAPSINPVETELITEEEEENALDNENVFTKIRKTIKDMAANVGLCTGSWVGCFICVGTFGGFPTLGPLPYSCITSCSLGIFTNCARFDLFSHFQG